MESRNRRSWEDYGRFGEAAVSLLLTKLIVAVAPFRAIAGLASWRGTDVRRATQENDISKSIVTAVRRASRRMSLRLVCIHEGLATHWMLRRRGIPSLLHYGASNSEDRLTAHIWVTLDGNILIGEEGGAGHARVATFPDELR